MEFEQLAHSETVRTAEFLRDTFGGVDKAYPILLNVKQLHEAADEANFNKMFTSAVEASAAYMSANGLNMAISTNGKSLSGEERDDIRAIVKVLRAAADAYEKAAESGIN